MPSEYQMKWKNMIRTCLLQEDIVCLVFLYYVCIYLYVLTDEYFVLYISFHLELVLLECFKWQYTQFISNSYINQYVPYLLLPEK